MQRRTALEMLLLVILLSGVSGCGPTLSSQKTLDFGPGEISTILVDPASVAQDINVSAKSDGEKISVFVYLSEDDLAVSQAITGGSESEKIIASEKNSSDIQLVASIPAGKEASIQIVSSNTKKSTVSLSITN